MKPLKSFTGISDWVMRIALVFVLFQQHYQNTLELRFNELLFYFSATFVLSALFLFVGGFLKAHKYTVVSALIILVLVIVQILLNGGISFNNFFYLQLFIISIALRFVSRGNN